MCNQLLRGPDAYRAWMDARTRTSEDQELREGLQLIKDTVRLRIQSGCDDIEEVFTENPDIDPQEAWKIARERGQRKLEQ
jgi:hypothetical protein